MSWSTSCVAPSASPKRAMTSRRRPRWLSSSSSRICSCCAISLNVRPSSANSSRPCTSTRCFRSPREIARVASTRRRSVRTIARPSMYATAATSSRQAKRPISSLCIAAWFAASMRVCGLIDAECARTAGRSSVSATSVRYRVPLSVNVCVLPGSASKRSPRVLPGPAMMRLSSIRTMCSSTSRPERASSRLTSFWSSGTAATTSARVPSAPRTRPAASQPSGPAGRRGNRSPRRSGAGGSRAAVAVRLGRG